MVNKAPAKKIGHTAVGNTQVPNDMLANPAPEKEVPWDPEKPATTAEQPNVSPETPPAKPETALAVNDEQMIAEIKQLSNTSDSGTKDFPILKLQHVTDLNGEANPLKGHFTIVRKDDLGEWKTEDLGETIKVQFLMQRYFLKMMKGDDLYTSGEFESDMEIIPLWKRTGEKSEVMAEGTPYDLQKRFLKRDDKDRVRSELNKLSKLYVLVNGELVVWKLSLTGTIAWSKYTKLITFAAGVVTAVGRTEEKKGTIKYFAPVFKAEERITDLASIKDNIQILRDMLPKKTEGSIIVEEDPDAPPFK